MTQAVLRAFIERARDENELLEANGSDCAAKARAYLLRQFEELLVAEDEKTVSVEEAAGVTGASEETIRRMVRAGEIPDRRSNPKGKHLIPLSAMDLIKGKVRERPQAARACDATAKAIAKLSSP